MRTNKPKILLGAVLAMTFLFGCQSTPAEQFVQQKDSERLIASVSSIPADTATPPEDARIKKLLEPAGGNIRIEIDADVVGENTAHPVARMHQGTFSQEEISGFFNHLFGGHEAYDRDSGPVAPTKADIESQIIAYKQYLEEGSAERNTLYTEDELREEVKRLEAEYAFAPEDRDSGNVLVSDGTMKDGTWVAAQGDDILAEYPTKTLNVSDGKAWFSVTTPTEGGGPNGASPWLSYGKSEELRFDPSQPGIPILPGSDAPEVGMSFDDALALCEGFFEAGNVFDIALADVSVVEGDDRHAYMLDFVRTVDGVSAASCHAWSDGNSSDKASNEEMEIPWDYETIDVIVSSDGIEFIEWQSKSSAPEIITENASVISRNEALTIFERMITAKYAPVLADDERLELVVDRIQLAPLRIREINGAGKTGLYVPTWVFYGSSHHKGTTSPAHPEILMAINALDGTIINLDQGY